MGPDDHGLFDPPQSKKFPLVKVAIAGVLAAAVGGAGVTLALPMLTDGGDASAASAEMMDDTSAEEYVAEEAYEAPAKKGKLKKAKKGKGDKKSDLIDLEPMVVSLLAGTPQGRSVPRLRMQVSIEMAPDVYGDGTRQRVRHAFISALQSVEAETLRKPGGIDALRDVLRDAAVDALGPEVRDVFITELIVL
ncbi:MAG: flagellar basal body-associated FliL family protein [Pseudomonadota bacterium]